ncbi:MAG: histidine phosphatase family protein [Caulobacteraceae bacterium]|nr:histidine phosphatase family protein [Caulobacteraceae bacterium]
MSAPIYLARHGETEFNRAGLVQGRGDSPLTEAGRAQARRVGAQLGRLQAREARPFRLWSSPLPRALTTAQIIAEAAGHPGAITVDERLAEIGGGSFEGLSRDDILARVPEAGAHEILLLRAPDGEGLAAVQARLRDWLAEVAAEPAAAHLAVSHSGTGRVLRSLWLGLDLAAAMRLPAPQDALFRLEQGVEERIDCA